MDGGTRLRLHRSGMTHSINVLHAVAESANIRHVVASQRRFCALAVRRLRLTGETEDFGYP